MCKFFSFVTEPDGHPNERFYFDWNYRKKHYLDDGHDSHSHICHYYRLNEDRCNKYEYFPFAEYLNIDQQNSHIDDRVQVESWIKTFDLRRVVKPLIIKPYINPVQIKPPPITQEIVDLLKKWIDIFPESFYTSTAFCAYVSKETGVTHTISSNIVANIISYYHNIWSMHLAGLLLNHFNYYTYSDRAFFTYACTFFDFSYPYDISSCNRLLEMGLLPIRDNAKWKLFSIYEDILKTEYELDIL